VFNIRREFTGVDNPKHPGGDFLHQLENSTQAPMAILRVNLGFTVCYTREQCRFDGLCQEGDVMKLLARSKVANGLVICLVLPAAASLYADLVNNYSSGLKSFSATDDFDLTTDGPGTAVVAVTSDPCFADPTGGDPSGFDPSGSSSICVAPSEEQPVFCVRQIPALVTAENGSSDLLEVYTGPNPGVDPSGADPSGTHFYRLDSTNLSEAQTRPNAVSIPLDCVRHRVWVVGRNDGAVDGDGFFGIGVRGDDGLPLMDLYGININNDSYYNAYIEVNGPGSLTVGGSGPFDILVKNISDATLAPSDLVVTSTPGLRITTYAAGLLSQKPFKAKTRLRGGVLTFSRVSIGPGDILLVTVSATLTVGGPEEQKLTATFTEPRDGLGSDDDQIVNETLP